MANWSNEITKERNDMVFENRNRNYGAFLIRRDYGKVVAIAGGSATIGFIFLIFFFVFISKESVEQVKKEKITQVNLKDAPPVNKDAPPPPPPPPPPLTKVLKFTTPEITEKEVDPPLQNDTTKKIGIVNQEGEEEEGPPVVDVAVEQVVEEIFTFAEVMPDFSGKDGFQAYLKKNVRYPFAEKDQGKQGTVYISFVVEKDGTIANVKAAKEVAGAPGFTKEAIRVISLMPKWTPGMMNGHPVRIEITQPVRFTLQ